MKRFIIIVLTGIAVALGTASPAQAHDRCYRPSYYSHSYSRGYCAPRYYSSYNYCPPVYYRSYCAPTYYRSYCPPTYYRSYGYGGYCAPRYYGSGISISFGRY
jgi:hypothetical protein